MGEQAAIKKREKQFCSAAIVTVKPGTRSHALLPAPYGEKFTYVSVFVFRHLQKEMQIICGSHVV
jgi:hypothetical protein